MLLDTTPKDNKDDLFARELDINKLEGAIRNRRPLIIVTGTRRVGKTSLVKAIMNDTDGRFIHIDTRLLSKDIIPKDEAMGVIQTSLQQFLSNHSMAGKIEKLRPFLEIVKGVSFGDFGIALDLSGRNLADIQTLFLKLDQWAEKNGRLILSIDEAQNFAKTEGIDLTRMIAYIYDNCKNITMILTGSEIGLLFEFLAFKKPNTPLGGRYHLDMKLEPLKSHESEKFLFEGFKQIKKEKEAAESAEIIRRAVLSLDGIVGWLVNFAARCIDQGEINERAITETQKEGSVVARDEFDRFLGTRTSDKEILLEIMEQAAMSNFSEFIKANVSDSERQPFVQILLDEHLLTIIEGRYIITDPLLAYSFQNSRRVS